MSRPECRLSALLTWRALLHAKCNSRAPVWSYSRLTFFSSYREFEQYLAQLVKLLLCKKTTLKVISKSRFWQLLARADVKHNVQQRNPPVLSFKVNCLKRKRNKSGLDGFMRIRESLWDSFMSFARRLIQTKRNGLQQSTLHIIIVGWRRSLHECQTIRILLENLDRNLRLQGCWRGKRAQNGP